MPCFVHTVLATSSSSSDDLQRSLKVIGSTQHLSVPINVVYVPILNYFWDITTFWQKIVRC